MTSSSSPHRAYGRATFWSGSSVRLLGTPSHFLGQNVIAMLPEQQRTQGQREETVETDSQITLSFPPQKPSGLSSGSQNLMSAVPKTWNPHGSQKTVTGKKGNDLLNKSKHIKSKNMLFCAIFICKCLHTRSVLDCNNSLVHTESVVAPKVALRCWWLLRSPWGRSASKNTLIQA